MLGFGSIARDGETVAKKSDFFGNEDTSQKYSRAK